MRVLSAAQMREVDRLAIEEVGIPEVCLMENAGRAVADALEEALPDLHDRPLLVVCGRGNNGGDGMVAARHLANRGHAPQVLLLGRVKDLRAEALRGHARALERMGVPVAEAPDEKTLEAALEGPLAGFEVIVDAVFGTGFRPPATGLEARAIEAMSAAAEAGAFVVAIDLPSGLDADSHRVDGPAVDADLTVALAAPKLAHVLDPAAQRCGTLVVADISIPRQLVDSDQHRVELVDHSFASALVLPRPRDAHKGDFGHLLVVAGSRGKTGAAVLAARAALRAGAGLVTVATPASCLPLIAASLPEAMTEPLPETAAGTIAFEALERVRELAAERDALAIGPGLTTEEPTRRLVRSLLADPAFPLVADADALNAFDVSLPRLDREGIAAVITPHPGEAGRLLGRAAGAVNDDRVAAVAELSRRSGATVVLKGQRTLVAGRDGRLYINTTGNPGMATGGTGDALTGMVGALLASGRGGDEAAVLGAYLHGLAGDLAAGRKGEESLIASDLIEALPEAFRALGGGGFAAAGESAEEADDDDVDDDDGGHGHGAHGPHEHRHGDREPGR